MRQDKLDRLIETAYTWAKQMHEGQKYGEKDYFEAHIEPVVRLAEELVKEKLTLTNTEKSLVVVVAYLHDIVEDTTVTIEDIRKTFGSVVAQEIVYLTKSEKMKREQQWAMAKRGTIATIVKKADMLVNLEASIKIDNKRLVEKYLTGLGVLGDIY